MRHDWKFVSRFFCLMRLDHGLEEMRGRWDLWLQAFSILCLDIIDVRAEYGVIHLQLHLTWLFGYFMEFYGICSFLQPE